MTAVLAEIRAPGTNLLTHLGLPAVSGTSIAQGRLLNAATACEPVGVFGPVTVQPLVLRGAPKRC
jgi:hypothetical protein